MILSIAYLEVPQKGGERLCKGEALKYRIMRTIHLNANVDAKVETRQLSAQAIPWRSVQVMPIADDENMTVQHSLRKRVLAPVNTASPRLRRIFQRRTHSINIQLCFHNCIEYSTRTLLSTLVHCIKIRTTYVVLKKSICRITTVRQQRRTGIPSFFQTASRCIISPNRPRPLLSNQYNHNTMPLIDSIRIATLGSRVHIQLLPHRP